jgi:hypothetical protein
MHKEPHPVQKSHSLFLGSQGCCTLRQLECISILRKGSAFFCNATHGNPLTLPTYLYLLWPPFLLKGKTQTLQLDLNSDCIYIY